jgi:hypothetical protein
MILPTFLLIALTQIGWSSGASLISAKLTGIVAINTTDNRISPSFWYPFAWSRFDIALSQPTFRICTKRPVVLRITDGNCPGDRFQLLVNGKSAGFSSDIGGSFGDGRADFQVPTKKGSIVAGTQEDIANAIKFGKCDQFQVNPSVAYDSGAWSRMRTTLSTGCNKVQVRVVQNPFGQGTGFLRYDYAN